jgi:hypothetical protein
MTAPIASGWSKIAGWDLHPLRNAALTRRTPECDIPEVIINDRDAATMDIPVCISCLIFSLIIFSLTPNFYSAWILEYS